MTESQDERRVVHPGSFYLAHLEIPATPTTKISAAATATKISSRATTEVSSTPAVTKVRATPTTKIISPTIPVSTLVLILILHLILALLFP